MNKPRLLHFFSVVVIGFTLFTSAGQPANATRKTNNVVIVGDSVANVLRWAPASMKPLWKSQYNAILETSGCQQLLRAGCLPQKQLSSLERIVKHRNDNIDVYVVATGYDDTGPQYLAMAMRKIVAEVKSQGASLIWLTYQVNGNVKRKSKSFNKVLLQEQLKNKMEILDWNLISSKKTKWFPGGGVHMNGVGGIQLGRSILQALDIHFGRAVAVTTTTTTTTTAFTTTTVTAPE